MVKAYGLERVSIGGQFQFDQEVVINGLLSLAHCRNILRSRAQGLSADLNFAYVYMDLATGGNLSNLIEAHYLEAYYQSEDTNSQPE